MPQWFGSPGVAVRFTHAPLQFVVPLGHVVVHEPLLQTWFAAHWRPPLPAQPPQLFGSLLMLTQSPLHSVSVGSHAPAQVPPLQTGVLPPQVVVHEPQCVLSVSRSTQTPLHAVSPGAQQIPLVQVSPAAHATPVAPAQPPQFASSVIGSEHVPPQLFSLAVQHATPVPAFGCLHDSPIVVLQLAPHMPQFALSASRLHEPLQFDSPAPQHTAGVPDVQLSPIAVSHVVPHMPQFALSVCVFLHEPLQHVSLPPHAIPHMPQFASSLCTSTHVPLQFV